jgi:hypothetical protein
MRTCRVHKICISQYQQDDVMTPAPTGTSIYGGSSAAGTAAAAAAAAAAATAASVPARRRKINNLAQSLGRMAHVKSKTVAWLKMYEKSQSPDSPCTVSLRNVPSILTLRVPPRPRPSPRPSPPSSGLAPATAQLSLHSPLSAWSPDVRLPLPVVCSFCATATDTATVSYNVMLPCPYVLSCASCAAKK